MGYGGGGPYSPYGSEKQLQFALTDEDGSYTIKNLEEGDYRILVLDPAYIYEGEYYKDFSPAHWDQATIIHITRSESHQRINMKLHVGETYSEKDEYPYILLKDYHPSLDYIGSSSGSWSWQGSGGGGGWSGASYGRPGFPVQPGGPVIEDNPVEIISDPIDQVAVGRKYIYQVQVPDMDSETSIKYNLNRNPAGMTIDNESGLIQWQPTHEDIGSSIIQVEVSVGSDLILFQSAFQSFRLNVVEDIVPFFNNYWDNIKTWNNGWASQNPWNYQWTTGTPPWWESYIKPSTADLSTSSISPPSIWNSNNSLWQPKVNNSFWQ